MSVKKLRDFNPQYLDVGVAYRYDEFLNLLLNNIVITHKDGSAYEYQIETFIKKQLIECGRVGYDKVSKVWANISRTGRLNEYGNMTSLTFMLKNGKVFRRQASYENKPNGAYAIMALPHYFCLSVLIQETAEFISNCEIAIKQNLDAVKTPYIITAKSKDMRLSIEHAIQQKEDGTPVIVVDETLGDALKPQDTSVEYIADKIDELKQKRVDLLLNKLGIMSANINKKERVQVGEVNATVGQCLDYIYLMIDTFNKQMDYYGIDAVMSENTSLEEYSDNTETENNNKDGQINYEKE